MRSVAHTLKRQEDDPAILALRDFYLEAWSHFLPGVDLAAAVTLSTRIAMICRALTYYRMVSNLDGALKEQYNPALVAWLQAFLDIDAG